MAADYDFTLSWSTSPKDHVRHLLRDVVDPFFFKNEEIENQLSQETAGGEATVYFAAAHLLETLLSGILTVGRGISEKEVGRLRIKFGLGERGTASEALVSLIAELKQQGAYRQTRAKGYVFRVLATH